MEYNNKVLKLGGDFTMSSTSYNKKEIEEKKIIDDFKVIKLAAASAFSFRSKDFI